MNVTTANSFRDLDQLFNSYCRPVTAKAQPSFSPRVDIIEQDDSYQLIAELAGISKVDINITVKNSVLTIAADHNTKVDNAGKVLQRERQFGKFERSFKVGKNIEQENIAARFQDGLLYLTVPKIKPTVATSRNIEVH